MGLLTKQRRSAQEGASSADPLLDVLRQSELVDRDWYLRTYGDVAAAGMDPVEHYLQFGAVDRRNPNPLFITSWYLERNPDVAASGANPLIHFVQTGAAEGRDPGPDFDTAYYAGENPSVEAAGMNPLLHYLRFGRAEGRRPKPRDDVEAYEGALRAKRRGVTGAATALFRGPKSDHVHFRMGSAVGGSDGHGLPMPMSELLERTGKYSPASYERTGRVTHRTILRALPREFRFEGARCLDFGCGVARVLRHFAPQAKRAEFWGCDIEGAGIRWCVEHLTPPFRFFQIAEAPTIPFEDSSFDLVYAASVFSRITLDWHHWMMEIRRILKPGGTFFVAFLGPAAVETMLSKSRESLGPNFGMYVQNPHDDASAGGPKVFLSAAWIRTFWGSMFDIDLLAMDALLEEESFCILRKPRLGAPLGSAAPVLESGTTQPFDPDAVGRILARPNEDLPFRESYGIDARGRTDIGGWIAFRGGKPLDIEVSVDGRPLRAKARFEGGEAFRDWPGTVEYAWTVDLDFSSVSAGEHRLEARLRSNAGKLHAMSIPLIIREG